MMMLTTSSTSSATILGTNMIYNTNVFDEDKAIVIIETTRQRGRRKVDRNYEEDENDVWEIQLKDRTIEGKLL